MAGYIYAHRSIMTHKYFKNEKLFKVMMYCLFKASHKEHETMVGLKTVALKKGQFVFGREKASQELNMKPSTVWKYFKVLEVDEFIDINSNNKFSVVTVANWESYQYDEAKDNNKVTTKGQQSNTNNKGNNGNNKYTTEFEQLYNTYPRSENKAQTYNNYKKLLKKYSHNELLKCVKLYNEKVKKDKTEKQYMTSSSNFFGKKAVYLDYIEEEVKEPKYKGGITIT